MSEPASPEGSPQRFVVLWQAAAGLLDLDIEFPRRAVLRVSMRHGDGTEELFDRKDDPGEGRNLIGSPAVRDEVDNAREVVAHFADDGDKSIAKAFAARSRLTTSRAPRPAAAEPVSNTKNPANSPTPSQSDVARKCPL